MSLGFCSLLLLAATGQVTPEEAAAATHRASLERILSDLSGFEMSTADETSKRLTLHRSPVLRWSNPIRNVDDAAVFVWLDESRPALVVTVMSYRDHKRDLRRAWEFLSLSPQRLEALQNGVRVWHPEQPGIAWTSLPGAPAPAETPADRRRQMRHLAAQFQVAVQSDQNRYELRLLSQPLYRYETAAPDQHDGALFAFVEGTDPELILALETQLDEPGWRFATGRLTRWAIEVRYRDRLVGEFPHMTGAGETSDVYHIPDDGPLDDSAPPARPGARDNPWLVRCQWSVVSGDTTDAG